MILSGHDSVVFFNRLLLAGAILLAPSLVGAQETMAVLEAGSQTYSNVTVTSKTSHYIVITHARGMTSVKLKDLSRDVLKGLGYNVDPPVSKQKQLLAKIQLDPRIKEMQEKITQEVQDRFHQLDQGFADLVALDHATPSWLKIPETKLPCGRRHYWTQVAFF